jgi:citrate lyase subunit beta / citryl-CoA lyase
MRQPEATASGVGLAPPVRSALFVPANRRRWIEGVHVHGADAVVLDLEDATPLRRKAEAREVLSETIPTLKDRGQGVWVRVNELGGEHISEDVEVACQPGVTAICLPKVRGPEDIRELDMLIGYYEGRNGLERGTVGIYPLLETAAALNDPTPVFSASARVRYAGAVAAPNADVAFAVGYRWSESFVESLALRSNALLAARACGVTNLVTGLVTSLDVGLVRRFAVHSRDLGYTGMFVIHPTHVAAVNEAFTPTDEEYWWSREILDGFASAVDPEIGAILDSDGMMIDEAMVQVATQISERHDLFAERDRQRDHG